MSASPKDLARWAFWVPFREALDPREPQRLARLYPLWRLQYAAGGAQKERIREELQACFGRSDEELVREAYRIAFRVHLEELLLGKVGPDTVHHYMVWEGRERLDEALSRGKGAVLLLPHAGNIMMMIALLAYTRVPYTQYAARGLAPEDVARANPETFGHNRWRQEARQAREDNEDKLPCSFLSLGTSVRELYRRLGRNETVGIGYDGRIGNKFAPFDYLGRTALLNTGPYRIAASTGAAIVPLFNLCPAQGPNRCQVGQPLFGKDWRQLAEDYLDQAQAWLRANPSHYGIWLAHARERRAVDDHPFFVDYAPDERYRRWM